MGAPTTYATLQATVADYINKKNLTSQIGGFIAGAEADLSASLRDQRMIGTHEATVADETDLVLPSRWVAARRIMVKGAAKPLAFAPLDQAPTLAAAGGDAPTHYTLRGSVLDILPGAAAGTIIEMVFYQGLMPLSDANPCNWLLQKEPMLYIYAACLHSAPFLVDDERIPIWQAQVDRRVETLNAASGVAQYSGAPLVRRRRGF